MVAMVVDTEHQPSNGEGPGVQCAIAMVALMMKVKRSLVMKSGLLASAAILMLSAGYAFAANPGSTTTDPTAAFGQAPSVPYGSGGYVYPQDGSPSGDIAAQVAEPQQPPPSSGALTHVYLYPPAQDGGAD
jgi:hypothetical protein